MMMIEDIKKDINNSLKEIQANTGKHGEPFKEDTHESLKETHTEKHNETGKEMNKTIQDLKMEIETKKSQRETILEIKKNLEKRSSVIDENITNGK